ncbi:hypothetical protein GQ54DRAFT_198949 [Martensiomyces pterosporus]|nr:hypothetical protein GQ54DRAFT_198949 [Martensiomyces pterosporus]
MLLLVGMDRALGTVWWLKPGAELAVGRKGAPLLVDGDHSVSRQHAAIVVTMDTQPKVKIRDKGSKFGLYVNGHRCASNQVAEVKVGDNVTFGGQASTFQLRDCSVAFCPTNMGSGSSSTLEKLSATAESLGISFVSGVDQCTHLMTPALAVTSKVIKALVYGRWIVSPDYVRQIESMPVAFKVDNPAPSKVDAFVESLSFLPVRSPPAILPNSPIDLSGVDWNPDPRRQGLFDSRLFVFVDSAQHGRHESSIRISGGTSMTLDDADHRALIGSRSTHDMKTQASLSSKEILSHLEKAEQVLGITKEPSAVCIVLPPAPPRGTRGRADAVAFARSVARLLGVRPISESEIGLAVLFVSCKDHTNPMLREQPESADMPIEEQTPTSTEPAPFSVGTERLAERSANAAVKRRTTRKAGMDSFWANMISGESPGQPRNDRALGTTAAAQTTSAAPPSTHKQVGCQTPVPGPNSRSSATANTAGSPGSALAGQTADNAAEAQRQRLACSTSIGAMAAKVSLIKPKMQSGHHRAQDTSLPNFKRFRKTTHPYQLA